MSQATGSNAIVKYIQGLGRNTVGGDMPGCIQTWLAWYKGSEDTFHKYKVMTGRTQKTVARYTLGMAKTVCEDFASLLLNEKVQITAEGFPALPDILADNAFYDRANRLMELTMALGTGAFVEFLGPNNKLTIDYIRGDMIYPLSWDGDSVTECAFGAVRGYQEGRQTKQGYYVQLHTLDDSGQYVITNAYLDENGKERPAPEGVELTSKPSPMPLFQLIRPNLVNCIDLDSPLGMSVYGAAIDQLKACDLVYDSYVNEFVLGKKRLMIPQSLATLRMQEAGVVVPVFDPNDTVFHVYQVPEDSKDKIEPVDMSLRTAEHEAGLQRMVDLLSKRCGLGTGRYEFARGAMAASKTATEVISEQGDLYQSLCRHEKPLERAIKGMVHALGWLAAGRPETDCAVVFDDSIIEDKNAIIQRNVLLINNGLRSRKQAVMEIEQISEPDAVQKLQEIAQEQMVSAEAVDLHGLTDGADEP